MPGCSDCLYMNLEFIPCERVYLRAGGRTLTSEGESVSGGGIVSEGKEGHGKFCLGSQVVNITESTQSLPGWQEREDLLVSVASFA